MESAVYPSQLGDAQYLVGTVMVSTHHRLPVEKHSSKFQALHPAQPPWCMFGLVRFTKTSSGMHFRSAGRGNDTRRKHAVVPALAFSTASHVPTRKLGNLQRAAAKDFFKSLLC